MTTLEDFFTLTEMRDGLSDIVRVEELLRMVQDVNEGIVNNLGEAIRQWSTVASTVAATQNNECLGHFVQLDGLCFLNRWLREALDSNAEVNNNNVKELIDTLLTSLEKLPIDNDKLTASGIAINLRRLLHHENVEIMKKASLLCDKWNLVAENASNSLSLEQGDLSGCPIDEKVSENDSHEANPVEISSNKEEDNKLQTSQSENVIAECHQSKSSHLTLPIKEDIPISDQPLPSASLNLDDERPVLDDANSSGSLVPNSVQDVTSIIKESSVCADGGFASTSGCAAQADRAENVDSQCHTLSENVSDSVKEMDIDPLSEKPSCHSSPKDADDDSPSSVASVSVLFQVGAVQPVMPCNLDSKVTESNSTEVMELQPKGGASDTPFTKCSTIMESELLTYASDKLQEERTITNAYCTTNGPQFSCQRNVSDRNNVHNDHIYDMDFKLEKENASASDGSLKLSGADDTEEVEHTSEVGFMCVDDALEVARQVAIEVEREVVDYREAFCSSPEVNFGEDDGASSSDSEEVKQNQGVTEEAGQHSSSSEEDNPLSRASKEELEDPPNVHDNLENLNQGFISQTLNAAAQGSIGKSEADRSDIDLNADIVSDEHGFVNTEANMPVNLSAPVAIIAPSRGAPVLPIALQFEGGMGWKGTAATSAFRPASPRRTSEREKAVSISKQKRMFLDIDLNVAESEEEVVVGQVTVKPMPCIFPSGGSSTEVSSQKADKLKLDLNRFSDEDASTYPTSLLKFYQNGEQSLLSSASSSSSKHPSIRDFDLNDNPSFLYVDASHSFDKSTKSSDTFGASHLSDPAIAIMGSRMVVERKDFGNQVQQLFPTNGFNMEYSAVAGPAMPYVQISPPVYGFAGLPNCSTLAPPQAFYAGGSFPYIEARGQTVMHQVTGTTGYVQHNGLAPSRPPLFMNVPTTTSNSILYGSVRPGVDMNAGMTLFDTAAKEVNFRQYLSQGQSNLMEDQTKATPQSSSSVLPLKRKESDSGWDSYPYGYKQLT